MIAAQRYSEPLPLRVPLSIEEHAKLLCANLDGYIGIAYKEKTGEKFSQKFARNYDDFMNYIHRIPLKECDVWVTHNSFYLPKRRTDCVRQLRALYVDIDCYKMHLTPDSVLFWLEKDYFRRVLPEPNLVIFSGQGLQLIWHIEPEGKYSIKTWKSIEKKFVKTLEPFGADQAVSDVPRILRLSGTIHQKTGRVVTSYLRHTYSESLSSIFDEYYNDDESIVLKPKIQIEKSNSHKSISSPTPIYKKQVSPFYNLSWDRRTDIEKLVELRADFYPEQGTHNGMHGREVLLFLYRYFSLPHFSEALVLEDCMKLNQKFKYPLTEGEVVIATSSAETGYKNYIEYEKSGKCNGHSGYRYTTKTLVELLEINDNEAKLLKTIIPRIEKNRRRKLKRREAGMKPAKGKSDAEGIKLLKATEPQLTQCEIANRLGVSQAQVSRVLNNISKKKG